MTFMKKTGLVILFLCISASIYSQGNKAVFALPRDIEVREEIDRLLLRFTYRVRIATDTVKNSDGHYYDNQALEIGENFNRYYSLFAENMDSVKFKAKGQGAGGGYDPAVNLNDDEYGTYEDIFFNYPDKGEITVYNRFLSTVYEYSEPVPSLHWDISSRTDTVLGYECFMAEAEFRGRVWRTWFTYEIPMPYGPWKLGGLPGLILKAEDADSLFVFEMAYGPWKLGGLPGLILKAEDADSLFVFEMVGISDFRNGDMHIYRYDERTRKCRREDILRLNDMRGVAPDRLNEMHGVKSSTTYMVRDHVTGSNKEISYGEYMALTGGAIYIPQMENE